MADALNSLRTPALLLDVDVLERNLQTMAERTDGLGVRLRPHIKTHKSVEVAERQRTLGARGITVSTLFEAEVFAEHGFDDITWAFPLVLSRLDQALTLAEHTTLRLVVDSEQAVDALETAGKTVHVWLKIDCGYHRAGVDPTAPQAEQLARRLAASSTLTFDGVLTHSGHAYHARSTKELARIAGQERDVMTGFARRMRDLGIAVPAVSVGSTPAMSTIDHLDGITETRPGNYVFYDGTQVALGVCRVPDCALTVLASVISAPLGSNHSVVDAGALALSKDWGPDDREGTSMGALYDDYGRGTLRSDTTLTSLSQEHGILNARLPVGSLVRILPNHSCLTAACFDEYVVVRGDTVLERWQVWRGRD